MRNPTKDKFISTLKDVFISQQDKGNVKDFLFESLVIPLLVKISGFDEAYKWLSQFGAAGVKEDLDEMFDKLNINVRFHYNTPPEKQAVFVFNHPTGPYDHAFIQRALHFFGMKGSVLGDEIMEDLLFVKGTYLPLNIRTKDSSKKQKQLNNISNVIQQGHSLILFPSGEVANKSFISRKTVEYPWKTGFIKFAKQYSLNIIPCYIDVEASFLFYLLKHINRDLASLTLFREGAKTAKKCKGRTIDIYIGDSIDFNMIEIDVAQAFEVKKICENLKTKKYLNTFLL